jgi:hypothetical protein
VVKVEQVPKAITIGTAGLADKPRLIKGAVTGQGGSAAENASLS